MSNPNHSKGTPIAQPSVHSKRTSSENLNGTLCWPICTARTNMGWAPKNLKRKLEVLNPPWRSQQKESLQKNFKCCTNIHSYRITPKIWWRPYEAHCTAHINLSSTKEEEGLWRKSAKLILLKEQAKESFSNNQIDEIETSKADIIKGILFLPSKFWWVRPVYDKHKIAFHLFKFFQAN